MSKPNDLKILDGVAFCYSSDSSVTAYDNFKLQNPSRFEVGLEANLETVHQFRSPKVGITKAKKKDVQSLMTYITPNGQTFFNNFFKNMKCTKKDDSDDD